MADFENDLCILLSDVARHMRTYSDQVARKRGMTRAQWVILSRLERQPNLTENFQRFAHGLRRGRLPASSSSAISTPSASSSGHTHA